MKERLIKALDIILVKQHLEVLKKDKLNSLERALTGRYSEGYGDEAITEITAKLESGNVRIMADVLRSDVKDLVRGVPSLVNGVLTPDWEFSERRQIELKERLNSFRKMLEDKHWITVGGYLIVTLSNEGLVEEYDVELLESVESNAETITKLIEALVRRHSGVSWRARALLTYHRVLFGYNL